MKKFIWSVLVTLSFSSSSLLALDLQNHIYAITYTMDTWFGAPRPPDSDGKYRVSKTLAFEEGGKVVDGTMVGGCVPPRQCTYTAVEGSVSIECKGDESGWRQPDKVSTYTLSADKMTLTDNRTGEVFLRVETKA